MSKVFVLGAGFSRAVADLPTMNQMRDRFRSVLQQEQALGHENRAAWGHMVLEFLEEFERDALVQTTGDRVLHSNVSQLLEQLLTFLDLNTMTEVQGVIESAGHGIDIAHPGPFYNHDAWEIRSCIETYIYLALERPRYISSTLMDGLNRVLIARDCIVSFNYDLVVETELYHRRRWFPLDGYGSSWIPTEIISGEYRDLSSDVFIAKVHGSLNWQRAGELCQQPELRWFYDNNEPIFPGYLTDETPQIDEAYQGKHQNRWLLPSYVKSLVDQQLLHAWRDAAEYLRCAREVVIVGYSLPEADSAAWALFATAIQAGTRIVIVDPDASTVAERVRHATGLNTERVYSSFDEYLVSTGEVQIRVSQ